MTNIRFGQVKTINGTLVQRYERFWDAEKRIEMGKRAWYLIDGKFTGDDALDEGILVPENPSKQNMIDYQNNLYTFTTLTDMISDYAKNINDDEILKHWAKSTWGKDEKSFQKFTNLESANLLLDKFLLQNYINPSMLSPAYSLYTGFGVPKCELGKVVYRTYPASVSGVIEKNEDGEKVFSGVSEISMKRAQNVTYLISYQEKLLSEITLNINDLVLPHRVLNNPKKYHSHQIRLQGYLIESIEDDAYSYYVIPEFAYINIPEWKKYAIQIDNQQGMIDKLYGTHQLYYGSAESDDTELAKLLGQTPMKKSQTDFPISIVNILGTLYHNENKLSKILMTEIENALNPAGLKGIYIVTLTN